MGDSVKTQQYTQGQLVYPIDLASDLEGERNLVGKILGNIFGSWQFRPTANPLAVTLSSTSLSFSIGGGGQSLLVIDSVSGNTRVADSCPQQTIPIPANTSGSARADYLWVGYQQITTDPHVVPFADGSNQTVYAVLEGTRYSYGQSSGGPSGYYAFATISVPSGATVGTQCTVTYSMPTASQLVQALASFPTNSVTTLNGKRGDVTLAGVGGLVITPSGNTLVISTPVGTTVNGLTGAVAITNADSSITVTTTGQSILIRANAPTLVSTLNGLNGAIILACPNGTIGIIASGNTIQFVNNGVTGLNGLAGALDLTTPDSSIAIAPSGSSIGLSVGASYHGMTISRAGILSGTTTVTTLPTLPAGNWDVYSTVWMNASVTATINGSGLAGGWAMNNPINAGTAIPFTKEIYGVGAAGDTPSVNVSATGTMAGICRLWAVRR